MYYYILNTKVPSRYLLDDSTFEDMYDDLSSIDDLQLEKLVRDYNKEKEV